MASKAVNNYITKRYERWLDYSLYHCGLAGIPDEATDVLNEVICSLLQKKNRLLDKLLETKKNGYTELDFFVLKMIKLNASSPTSQYRSRYKPLPVDDNVDYSRLDIEDIPDESEDRNTEILNKPFQYSYIEQTKNKNMRTGKSEITERTMHINEIEMNYNNRINYHYTPTSFSLIDFMQYAMSYKKNGKNILNYIPLKQ